MKSIEVGQKGDSKYRISREVMSSILTKVKENAISNFKWESKDAVISIPAHFNDAHRQIVMECATSAGLNVLKLVNSPTAAAFTYGHCDDSLNKKLLVVDFGGSSFNASLIDVEEGIYEVLATYGDKHLGGTDLDTRLLEFWLSDIKKKLKVDLTEQSKKIKRLRKECKRVKKLLSSATYADIDFEGVDYNNDYNHSIERAKFEELSNDLFSKCLKIIENVLEDSGITKDKVDEVILVGGSTKIVKIRRLIEEFFYKTPNTSIDSEVAIVHGAAKLANSLSGDFEDPCLWWFFDICTLSVGIESAGGVMTPIITRQTFIPCKKSLMFTTFTDSASVPKIKVFRGERAFTKDNELLGTFELKGIPPMPRWTPKIEVTFELDCNGIFSVSAVEKSTTKPVVLVINEDRPSPNNKQIEDIIKEASNYAEEDSKMLEIIKSRNKLSSYIQNARSYFLRDIGYNDKKMLLELTEEAEEWLNNNQNWSHKDYS